MMTKKRCIPILLLFYILLFSKTFCQQIKVAIGRNHLKELNVFGWNERFEFELRLFVVNLNTGNVITRFVAEGKTGHYDLATLEIEPHGKVTVEHVENIREEELPQSSRKGSGIARGRFELQIYMISPENINIKKTKKRFEKLPKGNEILLCLFNSIEGCEVITDEMKIMELERPKRNILFKMKLQKDEILHFQAIECTEIKDQFLNIKNLNVLSDGVGIEYDGPVCPMDKYTFHFLDINGKGTFNPFNCDEAIYFPKMNHYELLANGNCKLKLIEDNSNKDVKNTQGPQSSSAVAHSHSQQQMNKLKGKGISASNLPMNPPSLFPGKSWTNLMDFSRMSHQQAQFTHQFHSNPSIIHDTNTNPAIEKIIKQLAKDQPTFVAQFRPEHLKQAVNQFLQQQIQSQNSNAGIPSQSHNLLKSANVPRAHSTHQHSTISIATHQQHKPHISNSNPSYGSIAAGQNPPPTNFQRSQIPFALADQKLTKYLHENFDLKKHPQQILNDFEQHLQQYLADHQLPYVEPMPIYDSSHQQLINFEQKNIPQKNYYPNHMAIGNIQSGEYHPLLQQIFGQQQIGHFQSQKQIYHPNPTPPSSASLHQPLMEASASAAGKKRKELMPVEGQSQSESIPMDSNPAPKDVNLGLGLPSTGSSSNPPSSSAIV